jgi:hypothetical protein
MTSTAVDIEGTRRSASLEDESTSDKGIVTNTNNGSPENGSARAVPSSDHTRRRLKARHIQLIGTTPAANILGTVLM